VVQFPDVCFGGAPGLEAAEQLGDFFPTMDLHFAGGVALRARPLNYLFVQSLLLLLLSLLLLLLPQSRSSSRDKT
jgi:hypothetical protein